MKIISVLRPLLEAAAVVAVVVTGLRLLTGLFGRKSRVYQLSAARQFRLLFWPLLCLGVGLPFMASFLYAGSLSAFELILLLALAAVVVGFSFPAFVLHLLYYVRNQHTALVFDPKQNVLEVHENGQRIPFAKSDLLEVRYVTNRSDRVFWSSYNYLQLHLRSGQILTLTSLLLPLEPLADFLRSTPLVRQRRWFCWV
ncbi:hypothetical protein [Hymenobacter pini]|uniref:hypothetical protein n=1 Tax=Hymenobacter pini TaxID=2880879 RepID=UPI001CF5BB2B|nr:hypothetical protein [Hymenobacter pini]MCA8832207.1 hypothetical protein [Hymenobacter pini]